MPDFFCKKLKLSIGISIFDILIEKFAIGFGLHNIWLNILVWAEKSFSGS